MTDNKAIKFHILSKLKRSELENSYITLQKENSQLKKAIERQFNETNRLRCQLFEVLSVLNCKKLLRPAVPVNEKEKNLQLYIQLLNEKVSVLTHQLLNHSRFHTEVHKCFRSTTQNIHPCIVSPDMKNSINKQINELLNPKIGDTAMDYNDEKGIIQQHYQDEDGGFDFIREDEKKSDTNSEVAKVADNIDIIRLKMLIKRLTLQNAALSLHVDSADKETATLRKELDEIRIEFELSKQVNLEKQKYSSSQTLVVELTALRQRNKILQEEIREIQEEKEALKVANQKLLEELSDINEKVNLTLNLDKDI
ncbi:paramyosin isoform X2 [Halyomorpha halys]|uniref:paramyosin isoform X2 n=1 Tax=Halyomorpha halys TaxID=286706 RepID=UPI0034D31CD8